MTINNGMIEEFTFSMETDVASACSGALRKVRKLADQAPIGRLFASISTLSDATSQINQALEAGELAVAAARLKKYGKPAPAAEAAPLPAHFRKLG